MSYEAFNNDIYYEKQMSAFADKMKFGDQQVIEFGGKPFGDYHASRVLPGYDPDIKARILKDLKQDLGSATIAMSVHSKDIISPPDGRRFIKRIRGDSGLFYDDEVLRLVRQGRDEFDLSIDTVVLSALPSKLSSDNEDYLFTYQEMLESEGIKVKHNKYIEGYPYLDSKLVPELLIQGEAVSLNDNLIVISPGGGSGKFCVAVSELAHKLKHGYNPNFIKFETFPVFALPTEHPLNIAFLAATADLSNELVVLNNGMTNYDKDIQNLNILKDLISHYPEIKSPLGDFSEPTDMGVNVIESGIIDYQIVTNACVSEVGRRVARYEAEYMTGYEDIETVDRTKQCRNLLSRYCIERIKAQNASDQNVERTTLVNRFIDLVKLANNVTVEV